ncbi:MAG: M42 family peptidase [Phycisphaerales bacterium]|nr:MAG: M42 family peptidase [Phycisphaerales bacterium]
MKPHAYDFLKRLLEAPSPSGFEQPAQRVVREYMADCAETIETDVHGNVIVGINTGGSPRVMLAGHCDQIGMMVRYIDDKGFIFFNQIGGLDPAVLAGSRVTLLGRKGPVPGVIGRRAIHLLKQEERGAKIELRELWIDIGAKDKKEALKHVDIGDPAVFVPGVTELGSDLIASPAFDDKCGTWVVMEALRQAADKPLKCALFAVSTVQEEVGLRGARTSCFGVDPQVGIAVDVTHATDYPDVDKRSHGDICMGAGPAISIGPNINPALGDLLLRTARQRKIPFQREAAAGGTGTDANAIQLTRAGVATALVSVPNRYMHTQVEIVSKSDLTHCARLLAETVARIDGKMDFTPK